MRRFVFRNAVPRITLLLVLIIPLTLHVFPKRAAGLRVKVATNTCECGQDFSRTIPLHLSRNGGLSIGGEAVTGKRLPTLLSEIYGTRNDCILYLSADDDVPFQTVAEVINTVQQSKEPAGPMTLRVPPELRNPEPDNLGIEIRVVTPGAVNAPCGKGCYNWGKNGLLLCP